MYISRIEIGFATTESKVSESERMEEGVRVRVSLERFFGDERARVYMWARRGRAARWLLRRLRRAFPALPPARRLALRSRGHLLPPAEPLALLAPDDPLEVIPFAPEPEHGAPPAARDAPGLEVGAAGDAACAPDGPDGPPAPDGPLAPDEPDAALVEMKRRALRILERFEDDDETAPRRRRRVRRRRRAASPGPWAADGAEARDASVVRNGSPRAARIVRALSLTSPSTIN